MRQTVGILGTPIDALNTTEVLSRLEAFIAEGGFHQVATANTDFLVNALEDPELRYILRSADLVTPDGMPVVWAARLMRSHLPERVTGADLVPKLAELAARKGYRVYMLGAAPEVAQAAREELCRRYPGLQVVGCASPPVSKLVDMDHDHWLCDIEQTRPDILLIAFGNPKQEKWIQMNRDRLCAVPVCMGVGGTFDFIAGKVPRAPVWVQRIAMEWLHRLIHDPRRLGKRYLHDISVFSRMLLKQVWAVRRRGGSGSLSIDIRQENDGALLSLPAAFDHRNLPAFQEAALRALEANRRLTLNMTAVKTFDGAALGALIVLAMRASENGVQVRLDGVSPKLYSILERCQLTDGLLPIAGQEVPLFAPGHHTGLDYRVQCGKQAAVVTVHGAASDWAATLRLEADCAGLLRAGRRVDLDLQALTYADSKLLTLLHRLNGLQNERTDNGCDTVTRFRLVLGEVARKALTRDKLLDRFTVIEIPEIPMDAEEGDADLLAPMEPTKLYARGA